MIAAVETLTAATSLFVVATTWNVPAVPGAVYVPVELTLPPPVSCTDQVTAVDWPETVPETVALKVTLPPGVVLATVGEMATEITGGGGGAVTVTVAVALLDGSATLVATTWNVPAVPGAVYLPLASTVPPPLSWTVQVTAVDPLPALLTVAAKVVLPPVCTEALVGEMLTEIAG